MSQRDHPGNEDRSDARTGYWKHTIACVSHVGDACDCGLEAEMLGRILELEAVARAAGVQKP